MSADAGLRTYADAMQEADDLGTGGGDQTVAPRLTYHDLCQPSAIIQHRAASTRFWRESVHTYRAATPHAGYDVLERLCAAKRTGNTCVYTSNVDGLFRRFPTMQSQLHEIHGCVEEWMCGSSLGFARDEDIADGQWRSRGGVFAAHNDAVCAAARRERGEVADAPRDGHETPWPPSCAALEVSPPWGLQSLLAHGSCKLQEHPDAAEMLWDSRSPQCPNCASPLRPCVVMFGDTDEVLLARQAAAGARYQEWEERMEAAVASRPGNTHLIVLEIGCGARVPSVRRECADVVRDTLARGGHATLVRINPDADDANDDDAAAAAELPRGRVLTVRAGARRALVLIESRMRDIDDGGGDRL